MPASGFCSGGHRSSSGLPNMASVKDFAAYEDTGIMDVGDAGRNMRLRIILSG